MARTLFANGKAHGFAAERLEDTSLSSRREPLLPPLELAQPGESSAEPPSPLVDSHRSLKSPTFSASSRPISLTFSPGASSPRSYQSPAARVHASLPALTVPDSPPPPEFASPNEAPFESISLDAEGEAAPPPQSLPTVPADPSAKPTSHVKRESWGGYGIDSHGKPEAHGVLPVHPDPPASEGTSTAGASTAATPETRASGSFSAASGTSTPRRHAPPAHPHPFPLPTSPTKPNVPVPQVTTPPHNSGAPAAVAMPPQGLGAKGASTLDKFISRTRPQHLPPKDKTEDEIHLHEWESMMAKSREHEAERRKREAAVRLEKERRLQAVTPRWEALLSNDFSVQKVRTNPAFRKLWFEGCPEHLRGKAWSLAIGNALSLHKDAYKTYSARATRAIEQGRFPQDIMDQIDKDLDETLPTLHIFHEGSPIRDDLKELLCTWVVYRSDSGLGYAPYVNLLAAMFIIVSPLPVAFISLVNFLARPCLNSFAANDNEEIDAFYRVFENLQADQFPKIYANCKNLGLRLPESYFRSVLVEQVPFAAACRLWDQIVLDGDGYIFRAALAIFGFLEPRLYYPDREEILSVLEGRNAATQAITEREIERARLRGEEYEDKLDGKLSVFGLTEGALFDWLEHDGWRDSRFERLVVRELPD
ncbi:hypothetical protein Q8F55_000289 [Vanrija albida]|uniref:Rab-GAP TBC domain-containing protein n=1 Tax=Vanrija albida TaxID=181172 RepID=A0ABR3QCW9_9TREE